MEQSELAPVSTTISPCLVVSDAVRAIEFYIRAFGAVEVGRHERAKGRIHEAELRVGACTLLVTDEGPGDGFHSPQTMGGSPVTLRMSVENLEAAAARAISAGALLLRPIQDQACGGRSGTFADPFGHIWTLYTHRSSRNRSLSSDLVQQLPTNGTHSPLTQKVEF